MRQMPRSARGKVNHAYRKLNIHFARMIELTAAIVGWNQISKSTISGSYTSM